MKFFKFISLAMFAGILILSACSKTSTTEPTPTETIKDYFPTTVNSYWKYNVYDTDSSGTWDPTTLTPEKWLVTAQTTKFNKSATELTPVDESNKAVDSPNYFAVEGNKIYSLPSYIVPKTNFQLPLNLADAWYLIVDKDGSSWSLGSQQVKDLSVPVPGFGTVPLNGTLTINCKKGTSKDIKWGASLDKSNNAQDYTLEYAFDGNTTIMGLTVPVKFTAITHNWYSKSIGLIRATMDPLTITATVLGAAQVYNMKGNDKVLTEYSIAK